MIPKEWKGFTASRTYRGVVYDITITRAGTGNRVQLKVDGKPIDGSIVPPPPAGTKTVKVEAVLS